MKAFAVSPVKSAVKRIITKDADAERMAKRAEIRQQVAEADAMRRQAKALTEQIEIGEAEVRVLTDEHAKATTPLQAELTKLEEQAKKALESGKVPDASIDKRRAELFSQVAAENHKLEKAIEDIRDRFDAVYKKRNELNMAAAAMPTLDRLAAPGIGNPALLLKMFVAKRRLHFGTVRRETATEHLHRLETEKASLLANPQHWTDRDLSVVNRRIDEWTAELQAANEEIEAAQQVTEKILAELRDE